MFRGLLKGRPSAKEALFSLDGDEMGLLHAAERSAQSGKVERYVLNTRPLRVTSIDDNTFAVKTNGLIGLFATTRAFSTIRIA